MLAIFTTELQMNAKKAVDGSYPDLYDGVRGMQFIEAVVKSHQSGNTWIEMK